MLRSFKHIMIMAAILVIAALAVAACGGDDDDGGDGGGSPAATAGEPSGSVGSETPTLAPDTSMYCSGEALTAAVETLFQSVKLTAEDRGLSVGDEEELRKDARTTLDHLCAASTPFQTSALTTYCEDLIEAIDNNVEGDAAAKEQMKDFYRVASCPTPAPSPG
jgi:hypothetical protein